MESKNTNEAKWDWIPCNYNLKRETGGKSMFWNLSPSIILTNPSGSGPDPNVKLFIDTEKSLQFSQDLGWNWHKSWNLPNISVRLEIKDSVTGEMFLSPKNLYSHLFAVKAVLDHKDNFHLVDIGLRGLTKIELLDGHAFFSAIKFSSTSYNNEGVKFHLVLCLYIMGEDDNMPKILNSTISPPIFVDSRKSARDSQILMEKKMSSFVEPFLPENLEKIFIKRENKRKNDIEIQIFNDLEGLFNYLTAPNIRHKVKHPLFLAMKFSKCVKLYYNSQTVKTESLEDLMETLQKQLCEDNKGKKIQSPPTNISNESRMFLLLFDEIGDSFKTKKIIEAVEPIQSQSFGLLYSKSQLPDLFTEITSIPELISLYRKNFATLFSASKIQRQKNQNDESDNDSNDNLSEESGESDDDESKEPIPSKKLKSDKGSSTNLVGLGEQSSSSNITGKDPFTILKEKKEYIPTPIEENPEKQQGKQASNINKEEKNTQEDSTKKFIPDLNPINSSNNFTDALLGKNSNLLGSNSNNNNPNIQQQQRPEANYTNNPNSNMQLFSFLEGMNMNKQQGIPNHPSLLNPFTNPNLLSLLSNNGQNPMRNQQGQKNIANLMGNAQNLPQNNQNSANLPNSFGMNFNNYSNMLNSLLMNSVVNSSSPFDLFSKLLSQTQNSNTNTLNNNQGGQRMPTSNNNPFNNNLNMNQSNSQYENLMKNLLMQTLKGGNTLNGTAAASQMANIANLLGNKSGDIIKKEEEK